MNGMSVSISNLLFLQLGVVWFLAMGFVYCGTYIVGAIKTGRAARAFHRYISIIFLSGAALIAGQGLISGELQALIVAYGLATLFEMLLLGFGWVALMWFLSAAYANEKAWKEERVLEAGEEI